MVTIIQRPRNEFGKHSDIAVHILEPSKFELEQAYVRAEINDYKQVIVYGKCSIDKQCQHVVE